MAMDYLASMYLFLPAALANTAPIFVARISLFEKWDTPMDFEKRLGKKRIFGDHKTWRGLISGVVMATLVALLQKYLFLLGWVRLVDYSDINPLILGGALGLGALLGDAAKSLIKRQWAEIPPGKSWIGPDQIDYVLGGLIALAIVHPLPIRSYLYILLSYPFIHTIFVYIGFKLRIRRAPI